MDFDFEDILRELTQDGICVLNECYVDQQLLRLNEEFDRLLEKEHPGAPHTPYSQGKAARIYKNKFQKNRFSTTDKVFFSNDLYKIARDYLGSEPSLNEEIFVVKDVVGSDHIAKDLHYDVVKTLKFFIYLNDTTAKNGAFTCVPGSHKRTAEYRSQYGDKINFENREITRNLDTQDFDTPIPVEGKAGTLIIFDTDVWHKTGHVSEGERRVMRGHTRPLSESVYSDSQKHSLFGRVIKRIFQN